MRVLTFCYFSGIMLINVDTSQRVPVMTALKGAPHVRHHYHHREDPGRLSPPLRSRTCAGRTAGARAGCAKEARLAEERRLEREKREEERAERLFQRNAHNWVMNFFDAVAKTATQKEWKPAAIDQARAYAEALVRKSDVPLPTIDPGIAKVIQSKFAYGIALDSSRRAVIPENFFNGQRQDWFPALYELKLTQVS